MALAELYHSLPSKVAFGTQRRAYINNVKDIIDNNIDIELLMTPSLSEEYERLKLTCGKDTEMLYQAVPEIRPTLSENNPNFYNDGGNGKDE